MARRTGGWRRNGRELFGRLIDPQEAARGRVPGERGVADDRRQCRLRSDHGRLLGVGLASDAAGLSDVRHAHVITVRSAQHVCLQKRSTNSLKQQASPVLVGKVLPPRRAQSCACQTLGSAQRPNRNTKARKHKPPEMARAGECLPGVDARRDEGHKAHQGRFPIRATTRVVDLTISVTSRYFAKGAAMEAANASSVKATSASVWASEM